MATRRSGTSAAAFVSLVALAAAYPLAQDGAGDSWLGTPEAPELDIKFMASLSSGTPPKFVYNHMPKCAGNTLIDIFTEAIPPENLIIESEFETVVPADNESFVVGSVREPCDYYVSLWSYGAAGQGSLHKKLNQSCGSDCFYGTDSSPAASPTFQAWLPIAVGTMGLRFNNSYPTRELTDCWVRTEYVDQDTRRCLNMYETIGGPVNWTAANYMLDLSTKKNDNPSAHGACSDYYNDESMELIRGGDDGFIFDAFAYQGCCEGGSSSTQHPTFRSPDAEVVWFNEQDEINLMCSRMVVYGYQSSPICADFIRPGVGGYPNMTELFGPEQYPPES